MKTFRLVSAALFAVLMCANFASCSKDDDATNTDVGGNDEGGNQEVTVSEKKLVKVVGKLGSDSETYEFSYDDKGRVTKSTETSNYDVNHYKGEYQFIWGDDAITANIKSSSNDSEYTNNYTLTLKNGLVQNCDTDETLTYNSSGRIASRKYYNFTSSFLWDSDKLVSTIYKEHEKRTYTYGESCKKGYCPLFIFKMEINCNLLYVANPELIGAKTTQLPTSITYSNSGKDDTTALKYDFDKEGYISKITAKRDDETYTYTLTWK